MRGPRRTPTHVSALAAVELDARLRAARNACEFLRGTVDGNHAERVAALVRDLGAALELVPEVADTAYTAGLRAGWREAGVDVDAWDAQAERVARDVFGEGQGS